MAVVDEMRQHLTRAVAALTDRGFDTNDAAELEQIDEQIKSLNRQIQRLNQEALLQAAATVAEAADGLENVVRSARTGPFDAYLERMQGLIAGIKITQEQAVNAVTGDSRAFPKTENPESEKALPAPGVVPATAAARRPASQPAEAPSTLPPIVNSTRFSDTRAEYEAEWSACRIRDERRSMVDDTYIAKLDANKAKYEQIAAQFRNMPWFFIGVIHAMETGFRFDRHLHNGDPLSARTVRVPKGFPRTGNPPFTWEASAKDAMQKMGYDQVTDWSMPHVLYLLEKYNGFGYRFKSLRTPYLWSFSNLYLKGRYVADGVFDPNAESRQCGAATMLKAVL